MTTPEKGVKAETLAQEIQKATQTKEQPLFRDKRQAIYEKFDAKAEPEPDETVTAPQEEPAPEEPPEPEKDSDAPEEGAEEEPAKEDAGAADEVLTLEEFQKKFGKVRIKGKQAGEEVEAPATEWVKASGLERHLQKRLQSLAEKERRLTSQDAPATPPPMPSVTGPYVPPREFDGSPLAKLTDDQVRERFDEIFSESPWKAEEFRQAVYASRMDAMAFVNARRAEIAVTAFRKSNPEVSDEVWLAMNDDSFISRHPEIQRAQMRGDWDSVLEIAHAKFLRESVLAEREALRKEEAERKKKTDLKKKGQVIRTTSQPPPTQKKDEEGESDQDYIRRLRRERKEKQGLLR